MEAIILKANFYIAFLFKILGISIFFIINENGMHLNNSLDIQRNLVILSIVLLCMYIKYIDYVGSMDTENSILSYRNSIRVASTIF